MNGYSGVHMKHIQILKFVCIVILIALTTFHSVYAGSPYSYSEWKDILAIGEDKDYTIGADLILHIEPDRYYRNPGDEIILSGILKGIFGPLSGSEILIERTNNTSESTFLNTVTNDAGVFVISDLLTEPGIYTYQATYDPGQEMNAEIMKSQKLEISCIQSDGAIIYEPNESSLYWGQGTVPSSDAEPEISVNLNTNTSGFIPGQQVSFSGKVTNKGRPVAYAPVSITPEITGFSLHGEPVVYQTSTDGTMNTSFHMTGPDPLSFSLSYQKNRNEPTYQSEPVIVSPLLPALNPPARIVHTSETLDAYIDNESVESLQNITLYGWYCTKEGEPGSLATLDLVWYNFGGKFWDQYQNSSKILTNAHGLFECTVPAPQTPGMYLLAIKREGNSTTPAVYSNVIALPVTPREEETEEIVDILMSSPGQVLISAVPVPAKVSEELTILVSPVGIEAMDSDDMHLSIYYSMNGIDWSLFEEKTSGLPSEEMVISVIPEEEGYLYFKATLDNHAGVLMNSQILVIPVIK